MRILVLQLARFGDIYQTWPIVRALRRKYPEAEINLLVRERYSAATSGLGEADKVLTLPSKKILAPLLFSTDGEEGSLIELDRFLGELSSDYDQIINLSFSPFSSYLVDEIKTAKTEVRGYDRFSDGFLDISDDASAYFYAQVGVGRPNRIHLIELFAMVANVEIKKSDFKFDGFGANAFRTDQPYVVLHVGASQSKKACSSEKWQEIIRVLLKKTRYSIYLVGSSNESLKADWMSSQNRIVDLCGHTSLEDLFPLVAGAEGLIACDSMMIQLANLTDTFVLNISFPTVNLWETGPRVLGSKVLFYPSSEEVRAKEVVDEFLAKGADRASLLNCFHCTSEVSPIYSFHSGLPTDFQWQLIKAMYLGENYPIAEKMEIVTAFTRLHELAILGIENVDEILKNPNNDVSMGILNEIDQLMLEVSKRASEVRPVIQWFLTEKSRMGPSGFEEIVWKTRDVFEQLRIVTRLYILEEEVSVDFSQGDLAWK